MTVPPTFVAGDKLKASQMNKIGMWTITPSSVTGGTISGSQVTVGTTVSSIVLNGIFSADYDRYRITYTGGVGSATSSLKLTLGATATGYKSSIIYCLYSGSTVGGISGGSTAIDYAATFDVNWVHMDMEIINPYAAKRTLFHGKFINVDAQGTVGGILENTTSYTAATLTTASGTVTGGSIVVYGYNKG